MRRVVVQSSVVLFLNVGSLPDISMNQLLMFFRWTEEDKGEGWKTGSEKKQWKSVRQMSDSRFPDTHVETWGIFPVWSGREGVPSIFPQTWTLRYSVTTSELVNSAGDKSQLKLSRPICQCPKDAHTHTYVGLVKLYRRVWRRNDWSDCLVVTRPTVSVWRWI